MDLPEIGTAVGSGIAAFGAAWLALFRPLRKQQQGAEPGLTAKDAEKLRARLAQLEQQHHGDMARLERLEEHLQRSDERLQRAVTDEEFASYTTTTTSTIHSLTEKVGVVTGAVDAWYRGAATRGGAE